MKQFQFWVLIIIMLLTAGIFFEVKQISRSVKCPPSKHQHPDGEEIMVKVVDGFFISAVAIRENGKVIFYEISRHKP